MKGTALELQAESLITILFKSEEVTTFTRGRIHFQFSWFQNIN